MTRSAPDAPLSSDPSPRVDERVLLRLSPVPSTPSRLDLPLELVEDVVLRCVISAGRPSLVRLAEQLCCGVGVIEAVVGSLRDRRLVDYEGMQGRSYLVAATDAGRAYSRQRSEECSYAGPLPVSLDAYSSVVRLQSPRVTLDREILTRAFSDLVVDPELIDELGPAVCGGGAIFLYGPPGTGKSSIAERMIRAYQDHIAVPHCVEVQSQIITVFDPILHEPLDPQPHGIDPRWVVCRRPAVVVGGELHLGMLDLSLDRDVGTHAAPLQLRANNGVFVIDDFGRQSMTPAELLNRWIVPLDRRVDYLTLGGRKFEVPFEVKVVLSTNLEPDDLGDDAFFRRIHNKIYVGGIDDEQFDWVLARAARAERLTVTDAAAARLRAIARAEGDGELRAYLPGVVCSLAVAFCTYEHRALELTPALVDKVLRVYFARARRRPRTAEFTPEDVVGRSPLPESPSFA